MRYTDKDTILLKTEYELGKENKLTNEEILSHLLTLEPFQDKSKKSLIAKLGSMKVYVKDEIYKSSNKNNLVKEYIYLTGLPIRHFEVLTRLNIDTLEDMIEIEKERERNVA